MNRTTNIVIIDDGINYKELILENRPHYKLEVTEKLKIRKWRKCPRSMLSHATICAGIISKYNPDAIVNSIKILSPESRKGNVDQLVKALYWCADNNIDIVNLSLGSIYFKDFTKIKRCISDVTLRGLVIVAALNNSNEFTMPACLSNVIGVKSNPEFSNDYYHFIAKPLYGIDVLASGIHTLTFKTCEYTTKNTNSYAAPVITAIISKFMQQQGNLSFEQIRLLLCKNSNNFDSEPFVPFCYLNTDWIVPCETRTTEWTKESTDHNEIMILSAPDDISQIDAVLRDKSVIHTSDSHLISDMLLSGLIPCKKMWDINYYSDVVNSELEYIDANLTIPVLLFKNLTELSIVISSLFKNEGYFSVLMSDSFNCKSDIYEIVPTDSQMSKFLSYIYKKYKCDIIICNIGEANECINDFDYDVIISKSETIEMRYQHNNLFYEMEALPKGSSGDIYSSIKQVLATDAEIK